MRNNHCKNIRGSSTELGYLSCYSKVTLYAYVILYRNNTWTISPLLDTRKTVQLVSDPYMASVDSFWLSRYKANESTEVTLGVNIAEYKIIMLHLRIKE